MKQTDVERRLRQTLERATPEVWDQILAGCAQKQKGKVIPMTTTIHSQSKKRRRLAPILAGVAAALVLAVGGTAGFGYYQTNYAVSSVVALDVNPSVELSVSRSERVISATARNEDAAQVLGGLDLEGTSLNVALHALIGSMVTHGYIDELANSILITVEDGDAQAAASLQQRLAQEVESLLSQSSVEGSVLSQTVTATPELQQISDDYGLTLGKASLILDLVKANPQYTVAELAGLSVHELNLLASSSTGALTQVSSSGSPSTTGYVGQEAALAAALSHAGVSAADLVGEKIEFDWEDGLLVYEVEFWTASAEYEYDINAATGAVVKYSRESLGTSAPSAPSAASYIGQDAALAAAYAHAGVSSSAATRVECELDSDDGQVCYDIEFRTSTMKYEYEIDAYTGAVLQFESETVGNSGSSTGGSSGSSASGYISRDAALAAAYAHAGVSSSSVYALEVDFDRDDGVALYEIEFTANGVEYEYEIDAYTGAVLQFESEGLPSGSTGSTGSASSSRITLDEAKSAACAHAGISVSAAAWDEWELEEEDGVLVYQLEFCHNGVEYECEIHASTGAVLSWEQGTCDHYRHGHGHH